MSEYEGEEPVAIEPSYGDLIVELEGDSGIRTFVLELLVEDLNLLLPGIYLRSTRLTYGYHSLATDLGLRPVATFKIKAFTRKEEDLIAQELIAFGLQEEDVGW